MRTFILLAAGAALCGQAVATGGCTGDPDCPKGEWCLEDKTCGVPPFKCGMEDMKCCNGKDCTGPELTCNEHEDVCEKKEEPEYECSGDPDCPKGTWCLWETRTCGVPPWKCGDEGQPCCNGKDCSGDKYVCNEHKNVCEEKEEPEYECSGDPDCPKGTWCLWETRTCGVPPWKCGEEGQKCCNDKDCDGIKLSCDADTTTCVPSGKTCNGDVDCPEGTWCKQETNTCGPMEKEMPPKKPEPGEACGDLDWPCCAPDGPEGGECPKGDNLKCMDGVCRVAACGDPGWPCCAPDGPEGGECTKADNLVCVDGLCEPEH